MPVVWVVPFVVVGIVVLRRSVLIAPSPRPRTTIAIHKSVFRWLGKPPRVDLTLRRFPALTIANGIEDQQ